MSEKLVLLTSAEAVREAIAEYDELGRDTFLETYGYRHSRLWPLEFNGRTYDSKAIVGAAFGKQHGTPLKWTEFKGGLDTAISLLNRLGFVARDAAHPAAYLIAGQIYRRKDLLETYGGQLQSGIWTPKEFKAIFIFSGESGKRYGYKDEWSNGVFVYTGEGQEGDMKFTGGNKAIRDHRAEGKDLFLFADLGKGRGARFEGLFECASWQYRDGKDKNQNTRKIIVFDLVPVKTATTSEDYSSKSNGAQTDGLPLEDLRQAAYAAAGTPKARTKTSDAKRSWYVRSARVRDYVLARAGGVCEACDEKAPFLKLDGTPYLEPHHTTRLADEGPDHPSTVGAICPTCHRRIHSGRDGAIWNQCLKERLRGKERIPVPISGVDDSEEA